MTVSEFLDLLDARGYRFGWVGHDEYEQVYYRGHGVWLTVFLDSDHVQTSTRYGPGGFTTAMPVWAVDAHLAILEKVALPDLVAA